MDIDSPKTPKMKTWILRRNQSKSLASSLNQTVLKYMTILFDACAVRTSRVTESSDGAIYALGAMTQGHV